MLQALKNEINQSNKIAVPVHDGIEFISPIEVIYIKGDGNYSIIHFKDGKKMTVSKTLKNIEEKLTDQAFIRIHKSHLININELVKYVKHDGGYVILSNGIKLGVSRNKKQMLNDLFQ
jgi:two-component system LytT family response regulator